MTTLIGKYKETKCGIQLSLPDKCITSNMIADNSITADKVDYVFQQPRVQRAGSKVELSSATNISGGNLTTTLSTLVGMYITRTKLAKIWLRGFSFFPGTVMNYVTLYLYQDGICLSEICTEVHYDYSEVLDTVLLAFIVPLETGMSYFAIKGKTDWATMPYENVVLQGIKIQ